MIRTVTIINFKALDGLQEFAAYMPEAVNALGEKVFTRYRPQLLDELQYTPGPVKYPIEWTSERQRRAFFATDGFGRGIPTKRTGQINQGWRVEYVTAPTRATIAVRNRTGYAQYVVGRLAPRGHDPMQKFHRNTGWVPASETLDFWQRVYFEEFEDEFGKLFR